MKQNWRAEGIALFDENGLVGEVWAPGAAELAAAAPEMARLLADLEWAGSREVDYEVVVSSCPSCDGLWCDVGEGFRPAEKAGHKADCRLVAVLRKAGVVT